MHLGNVVVSVRSTNQSGGINAMEKVVKIVLLTMEEDGHDHEQEFLFMTTV